MAAIKVKLDEMMARRKIRLNELAKLVDITEANLSILKNDKTKKGSIRNKRNLCGWNNDYLETILNIKN